MTSKNEMKLYKLMKQRKTKEEDLRNEIKLRRERKTLQMKLCF